jgi:hypothetical protein
MGGVDILIQVFLTSALLHEYYLQAPVYLFENAVPTSKKSHRVLIKKNRLLLCTETSEHMKNK